jgi:hypothetical protein
MDTSAFQTYRTQDTYSTPSASPKSVASNSRFPNEDDMIEKEKIQKHLNYYFTYIQPVFPLFVPNHFTAQYNTQKIPIILIYAMCAVAAHFEDGSGQGYYSKAWLMLDEAVGHPSLALVQTLLLLIKYVEVGEPTIVGFFEKAKSLMTRVIEMCKVLKLHQFERVTSPDPPESETRKRTFCMVYTYDTFLW